MDIKFGKIKPNTNFFTQSLTDSNSDTFFEFQDENAFNPAPQNQQKGTRLNDYDSNLLSNNAYQSMPDESFKIEHKINLLEESLLKINNEIETLESLGSNMQVNALKNRKQKIEQEITELNQKYSSLGFGTKLSGQLASAVSTVSQKSNFFTNAKKFIAKNILAKISKKIDYTQSMKDALSSLDNINANVDELIQMQVPYGETISRYEKLTAYLNKANMLHSQISKNMNSITRKKA